MSFRPVRRYWYGAALLLSLLALTWWLQTPASPIEADADFATVPAQSPNDDKVYRFVELDNGLRALLISDPDTEKAAAALDVYVGSASNPADRGGLAHFLEHMLFLGTDKYPDSGEYARFISEHGGSRNAYTAFEHTNYFFDVDKAHLAEALDRFGQFFVAPRFDAQYVEREVNAVQAEYQLGLSSDGRRNMDVASEIVNPDHPYSILGVGSTETLANRDGDPVREDLLDFYQRYYSANLMTLVVLGQENLDELQTLTESVFSAVPNRQTTVETITAPLYSPGSLPMLVYIQPQASQRELQLSFPMPNYEDRYRSKPLYYLSNLIGHEGEGSLLSLLKAEGWAEGLGASSGISYRGGSAFSISISLTEAGLLQREQVLARVFDYVRMLRVEGPQQSLYAEQAQLSELQFRFREDVPPISYVAALANDMQLYPAVDILRGNYRMDDYDPALIGEILERYITPENVAITVVAQDVPVDRISEYYAVPYSVRSLPTGEGSWRSAPQAAPDPRLRLPAANEFVATDVEMAALAADNTGVPALVESTERMQVWYRQSEEFPIPKGAMYISFRSADVSDTPAHAAAAQLYAALLQDAVNEYTYPALLAGLNFGIQISSRGINFNISGYNDKQLVLLQRIVDSVAGAELASARFENIRADLIRNLINARTARAFQQVAGKASQLLLSNYWDEAQLITELESMTPARVETFADDFWPGVAVQVLLNGNYSATQVAKVQQALQPLLSKQATLAPPLLQVTRLNGGDDFVYAADIDHQDSVLFWYMQAPGEDLLNRMLAELSAQVVTADFFESLRTQQQLGYVVSAFSWPQLDVPGVVFMVQSPGAAASLLQAATAKFLDEKAAPDAVSEPQFLRHLEVLRKENARPDRNLWEQSSYFWREIARQEFAFDSRSRVAAVLQSISYEQWYEWYRQVLVEQRASLLVVAPGRWEEVPAGELIAAPVTFKSRQAHYERP